MKGNAGDDVQSVAGRVLGRLLHLNGRGMEPRVLSTSRRCTTFCGPLHFPPEHTRTRKDGSSAESWQCGEDTHVLRIVLYHLMVTGGEALPPSQHSCAREVATDDVRRGEDIQPR